MVSPVPVLLSPALAAAVRDSFAGDSAIDSMVVDLVDASASGYGDPFPDGARFVAVYRAPAGNVGDFVVLGGFADPDVANLAVVNRNAIGSAS